jgi:hypothetical protein
VIFSSNIIKRWSKKREEEKETLQEPHQIKGEVNIWRGERHFNFKNPF